MLTDKHVGDLEVKGYAVVPNVISRQECDQAIAEYKAWLTNFGDKFPKTYSSIIKDYNCGHMETTWRLRLRAKPVFEQLWKTRKLLTSFDAVAIGRPPEAGGEEFHAPGKDWLHADTSVSRVGLHAYEGALSLEETTRNDWTFHVMEGSHKHVHDYLESNLHKAEIIVKTGVFKLQKDDVEYFEQKNCRATRLAVPKGAMVLWDSRLIYANARPLPNRKTAGRWRFVIYVSMTPAVWASEEDIKIHQEAYRKPAMTNHWSSQGVKLLELSATPGIPYPTAVPDVARTEDAMKLSGMIPYDFNDGLPNGPDFTPVWKKYKHDIPPELDMETKFANGHI